uniref:Uncharacterized protein LOC111104729 n=1 Tax=Crassostrea virginica TaxID=6565 RepID=A0A8B8ATN0_CRAVI|nr:uncharacterized protein LOC111104729 [Crassostrea virginica]
MKSLRTFTYKPCCVGERWNSIEDKCVACPFGHYGENCTFTCNPPMEGYRCATGDCHCNKWACNVSITSQRCFTSIDVPIGSTLRTYNSISKDIPIVSTLHIRTYNSISKEVDNSTLSHSSTSGDLFSISPIQDRKKWKTVYIVFIIFGACLLLLFSLFVMERTRFMNKNITRSYQQSRQEIPEPSYCEIKDV